MSQKKQQQRNIKTKKDNISQAKQIEEQRKLIEELIKEQSGKGKK